MNRNNRNFPQDFPFQQKQEEEEFVHVSAYPKRSGKNGILYLLILLLVGGAAYGLFKTFYEIGTSVSGPAGGKIPVIMASDEPFKELPDTPGGMNIPHLDKQIYNKLDKDIGASIDQNEDSLQPLPSRDDLMAQLAEDENKKNEIQQVITNKKKVPTFTDNGEKITIKEDAKIKAPEPTKAKRIDVEKVLANKNLQEIWVQLGTFKAEDEATKSWQEVREKNSDIFGDVGIRVTKSESSKGAYYRLQSGPIYSEEEARELCKRLNARQQSCFYVSNSGN